VESHTRWELTTWADFQLCLHRLLMSTGCKSSHSGFLDVSRSNGGLSISGWIGKLSCLMIFSTSLSVAAFLRRTGGSMLEGTGSDGRGVEQRVPEMRCTVEFNYVVIWHNRHSAHVHICPEVLLYDTEHDPLAIAISLVISNKFSNWNLGVA